MRRLLVLAVVPLFALAACGGTTPKVDRLPDVTLSGLRTTDADVALRDLDGPTVVTLWAQWCTPCKRDLPFYEQFHQAHPSVAMLGVDWMDTKPDVARSLAAAKGLTYPLAVDSEPSIRGKALPQLILVDARGRIAYRAYVEIKSLAQLEKLVEEHLKVTL